MTRRLVLSLVSLLAAGPALAQLGNPAAMAPGTTPQQQPGTVPPHEPNTQDRLFVQLMASAGLGEVAAADLALSTSRNEPVRTFAQQMKQSHGDANAALGRIAQAARVPVPDEPMGDQKAMLERLHGLDPVRFDAAYLQAQLVEHQKAVQLLLWEIDLGQDPSLTQFAKATLPEVMQHLASVQVLIAGHLGVAPQGLGSAMPAEEAAQWRR